MMQKKNILAFLFEIDRFRFSPESEWNGVPSTAAFGRTKP